MYVCQPPIPIDPPCLPPPSIHLHRHTSIYTDDGLEFLGPAASETQRPVAIFLLFIIFHIIYDYTIIYLI